MPHKHNAERRHHIPKMQFKVTNWAEYEAGLRRRGSLTLWGCELAVPDHTTVSRRAIKLPSIARAALPEGPLHVVIDSTGLKVYGAGEWLAEQRSRRAPRQYRKLHLAVDANSGEIVAVTLTGQDVDDPSQVAPLLEQIP